MDRFISEDLIKKILQFIEEKQCIYCSGDSIKLNGEYYDIYGIKEVLCFLLGRKNIEEFTNWRNKEENK